MNLINFLSHPIPPPLADPKIKYIIALTHGPYTMLPKELFTSFIDLLHETCPIPTYLKDLPPNFMKNVPVPLAYNFKNVTFMYPK